MMGAEATKHVDTHEVYPNAPLALVVVEVRFPGAAAVTVRPLSVTLQRAFRDLLGDGWVIESTKTQWVEVAFGPGGSISQPVQSQIVSRFTVRDRTRAVAITGESVTIETTAYTHYLDFRETVEKAIAAAAEILTPDGISRIGMRYINEIRVAGIDGADPSAWREWFESSLLAPGLDQMKEKGFPATAWESAAQFHTGWDQKLVLRYGPRVGQIINPASPLRRPRPPEPGAFFLLDFDSFWEPSDSIPEFDRNAVIHVCDRLRSPIRTLFDLLVTEKLVREFRKEMAVD